MSGYISEENKSISLKRYTPMFIAALFTIAKIWKQPKCPSTDEWIKKMRGVYMYAYIHTYTYNGILAIKRKEFCHLQQHGQTWRGLH